MQKTFSYYTTLLYKNFFAHTSEELQKIHLNYGSLPFIIYVGKHPGCTPAELTKSIGADWGHSQRSINRLVQEDFLTKEKVIETDRNYHLNLTEQGELAFRISHDVFYSWDEEILSALTEEETSQLFGILEKLIGSLTRKPDMH